MASYEEYNIVYVFFASNYEPRNYYACSRSRASLVLYIFFILHLCKYRHEIKWDCLIFVGKSIYYLTHSTVLCNIYEKADSMTDGLFLNKNLIDYTKKS